MIKLFATDLDGTLLKSGNTIKNKDIEAIHSLSKTEIDFAIATGRLDRDILEICKEIKKNAHRVSQNGAFVLSDSHDFIHQRTFDLEMSYKLHEHITSYSHLVCISTKDEIYISKRTEELKAMENFLYFPLIEGIDFIDKYGTEINPSKYMLLGENKQLVSIEEEIKNLFGISIESYISDPNCLDIVPKGVSKADGLKRLAKHLHIKPSEIAVIGDAYNDIPMFEMTPNSFCMSSAPIEVRDKAQHIVDDVYEAIEQITSLVSN